MEVTKQTAVEWILQYLKNVKPNEFCSIEKIKELLEQAKEMEKQQIIDAYKQGQYDSEPIRETDAEQYYNENYGKAN